jgi:tRNA modification GTPase
MTAADTIVAIASAAGRGAVGIVRVSGPGVPRIAAEILGQLPSPRVATWSRFRDADGNSLDEGLALYFAAPASFTGEEVLELQGHGGVVVLDLIVARLLQLGCRAARAGEFSERAYCNGKIDLAQAEAVADLIDAGTSAAARAAVRSLQGEFSTRVNALQAQLTQLRIYVEAAIDFPDEEIEFLGDRARSDRLTRVFEAFDALLAVAQQGALLRDGLNVVIAGKPNAGKSSLLNRLVGDEVAIVTDLPGTTRDLLRHAVHLDGLPLNLIDTAGLRTAQDIVEAEGIRRATHEMGRADRVLYVVDAANPTEAAFSALAPQLATLPPGVPVTIVFNKIDLVAIPSRLDETTTPAQLYLSARTGAGIDLLRSHLKKSAGFLDSGSGALSARRRHLDALRRSRDHALKAADTLLESRSPELFAEDLRLAQRALGEITGEFGSDDLLGEIFGSFCIGK